MNFAVDRRNCDWVLPRIWAAHPMPSSLYLLSADKSACFDNDEFVDLPSPPPKSIYNSLFSIILGSTSTSSAISPPELHNPRRQELK